MENVDVLQPPTFTPSGMVKPIEQAVADEDWMGAFNLWIIQDQPEPALIYQQRDPYAPWSGGKLDVSSGGYYRTGELLYDGLREVEEELGKVYDKEQLTYLGRKLNISPDRNGVMRKNVVDICFVKDNAALETFRLQKEEVHAIVALPLASLLKVHEEGSSFEAEGIRNDGEKISLNVTKESFPNNWDNYHYKIALLAHRYLQGERKLYY